MWITLLSVLFLVGDAVLVVAGAGSDSVRVDPIVLLGLVVAAAVAYGLGRRVIARPPAHAENDRSQNRASSVLRYSYHLKRIGQGVFTFFAAGTVAFVLFRNLPRRWPPGPRYETTLDAYVKFWENIVLHQDFGRSAAFNQPVFDLLFNYMPWSVFISLFGLALGFLFNIFWGAALAYKEGTWFDKAGTLFALAGNTTPYYVAAIFALSYLGYTLSLFPTRGRYPSEMALSLPVVGTVWSATNIAPGFNLPFMLGVIWQGTLPILTGFVLGINGLAMRGNSIRVMESDYIRCARIRGLGTPRILQRYVARNAVLPMYTFLVIGIASIFSSNVIMEKIFTYPGVGWLLYRALVHRDFPLLMGAFFFYTTLTIIGILAADFTYRYIDPRAGTDGEREAY